MKKAKSQVVDELRPEYLRSDLGKGVRGKYLKRFRSGTNLALLSPDVAAAFPNDESVNDALRSLLRVARGVVKEPSPPTRTARKRATTT